MRLEGSLDAFSLPDIFALLSMTKKTGGLHLRRDTDHGAVWLRDGALTGGRSAIDRHSLARRIVSGADLDAKAVARARATADESQRSLVAAISALDLVEPQRIETFAGEQIVDVVFDLLRWDAGDFEFVVDEVNPDDTGLLRPVDEVVADARQRLSEWERTVGSLPGRDVVLHLSAGAPGEVELAGDQWSLLVLIDGRRTVSDIVDLSGRGEFAAVRCLGDLVAAGLVCGTAGRTVSSVVERNALLGEIEGIAPVAEPAPAVPEPAVAPEPPALKPAAKSAPAPKSRAKSEAVAEPAPALAPAPAPVPSLVADDADDSGDSGGDAADDHDDREHQVAVALGAVTDIGDAPFRAMGRDLTRVTPQRPEPFLPPRQPEHAESVAMSTSTNGALAEASAPAAHIERDPSVNKSLLLRLIAGVRGL